MKMQRTFAAAALPIALIVLLSAVPTTGIASAATVSSAASPAAGTVQWAYGANVSGSATWTNASGGYTASLTTFFGWETILNQSTGAHGSISLEAQRTVGLDYWLSFCKPTCSSPTWTGNVTFKAWQTEHGFANLTTNGTVTVNGTQVPALALENETNRVQGNVTETVSAVFHGPMNTHTAEYSFSVGASSDLTVTFAPALGLVPDELTPGLEWNSTSLFIAAGSWSADYSYAHTPMSGLPTYLHGPISGSVTSTGTVSLQGIDVGSVVLNDSQATSAAAITVEGPFHVHEGFLLLPGQADVLGSDGSAWSTYQNDTGAASTSSMDFASHQPHLGLLASSTSFAPQPTSQSTVSDVGPAGAAPVTPGADALVLAGPQPPTAQGGAVVQGQPDSVPNAVSSSACLVAGNCVTPIGGNPLTKHPSGVIGLLVIGLLVGTLVAIAVVVSRRRDVPTPANPNARLYPTAPAVAPPKTPPAPAETPSEDPLGHLW